MIFIQAGNIYSCSSATDKNNESAVFILRCSNSKYNVCVWVCVSQGWARECTGQWIQRHLHRHLRNVPGVFLRNASLNTTYTSTLCACFSKQDRQCELFLLQPGITWCFAQSRSLRTTWLFLSLWRILINQGAPRSPQHERSHSQPGRKKRNKLQTGRNRDKGNSEACGWKESLKSVFVD